MKVFLDTNVIVSAYVARGICADLFRYILSEHELVTSEVVLDELCRVLSQRFEATEEQVEAVESTLRAETVVPRPPSPSQLPVEDSDDRWVLASAIESGADLLVTGDADLLAVTSQSPVAIVSPRGCWERLRDRQ